MTLCNYMQDLKESMEKLRSPEESVVPYDHDNEPPHIKARQRLIKSSVEWWANLKPFKLGFDVWELATSMGLRKMILTQGPRNNPNALAGKKLWIDKHLGQDVEFTMTRDKGLVYGKILVDDWPEYIERWLKWRKRGLVVMPASDHNVGFSHPQVVRYDGTNFEEVKKVIEDKIRG